MMTGVCMCVCVCGTRVHSRWLGGEWQCRERWWWWWR